MDNTVILRLVGLFFWGYRETLFFSSQFLSPFESKIDDLSSRWKSLSLSEKEGPSLALKSDQATTEFSMVARFLTKLPINLDTIENTFNPLWRPKPGLG